MFVEMADALILCGTSIACGNAEVVDVAVRPEGSHSMQRRMRCHKCKVAIVDYGEKWNGKKDLWKN